MIRMLKVCQFDWNETDSSFDLECFLRTDRKMVRFHDGQIKVWN